MTVFKMYIKIIGTRIIKEDDRQFEFHIKEMYKPKLFGIWQN